MDEEQMETAGFLTRRGQCVADPITLCAIPLDRLIKIVNPTGHVRAYDAVALADYLEKVNIPRRMKCVIDRTPFSRPQLRAIAAAAGNPPDHFDPTPPTPWRFRDYFTFATDNSAGTLGGMAGW